MAFQNKRLRQASLFYAISLGLITMLAFAASAIGPGVMLIAMFAPALAVTVCRVASPEVQRFRLSEIGLSHLGRRYWPLAIVLPIIVLLPGYLIVWSTGVGTLSPLPTDTNPFQFLVKLAVSVLFGTALGALGEEVGWRGYLLPRLVETFGETRASLLTGFLHGFWHLPMILLTPYYHADAPVLFVIPLFLAAVTLSGPTYAYLRIASGSIIPAALMHRMWNSCWDALASRTTGESKELIVYLSGEAGLISIIMLAVVAIWVCRRATGASRAAEAA